ncbi:MAG: four helix bundle protein [Chloroflexi bacterium]|nr:MAG: four helix bundle protein [Chloroflexota bacterium]
MNPDKFKQRTQQLAIEIIKLVDELPPNAVGQAVGNQLVRAGTSVGANYRAACRAKSTADMVNKLKIVEEEADETLYWLEILVQAGIVPATRISLLYDEMNQILSMTIASIKTLRARKSQH